MLLGQKQEFFTRALVSGEGGRSQALFRAGISGRGQETPEFELKHNLGVACGGLMNHEIWK